MQRDALLSMQAELREFVVQTQIRLMAVRKLIADAQLATSNQSTTNIGESQPPCVPPHTGRSKADAAEQNIFAASPMAGFDLQPIVSEIETASSPDVAELHSTSNATDRLEAIKRRLAEQIQKT